MRFSNPTNMLLPFLGLSQLASSTPIPEAEASSELVARSVPNLWLAGDSTMAPGGGGTGTQGWGQYLQYSFAAAGIAVQNKAVAGRSARSYTREGRFQHIADYVKAGDWVVLEFGHNDVGSLTPSDTGKPPCPGVKSQTCASSFDGAAETVQTFPTYIRQATALFVAKGAKVVISTSTPQNVWRTGSFSWSPYQFYYQSWLSAVASGGHAQGVYFVPHGDYAAQAMKNLGKDVVNANFPNDPRHPAPYLADVFAKAFVLGLKCGTSALGTKPVNSTASLTSTFLGSCLSYNSTLPI